MSDIDWDDAYANGKYIPDAATYPPLWAEKSAEFRAALLAEKRCFIDAPHGDHPREKSDVFFPDTAPKGLMVFIHGGYWKAFDKSSWSHLAAGALARGYVVVIPSYVLCPEASIPEITRSIALAINMAASSVAGPIYLSGHSAGGHLVCRMLCNDLSWDSCFPARIQGVMSISGVHDLRPLLKTEMNDDLRLDEATASDESPCLHRAVKPVPTTAWVGADERPVFVEQSRLLARNWPHADVVIEPDKHHFDVIDGLEDPESAMMRALLG